MEHSYDTPTKEPPAIPAGEQDFPVIQSGRYVFIETIGSGGAGVVYKARDESLDKIVAIKILHKTADGTQAVRFQREAKLAGSLNHRNVLSVIDFGLTDKNEPYLVMPYVSGQSLADHLKEHGPPEILDGLDLLVQIAGGLAHAHKKKIIHRDIKPSNIMLSHTQVAGRPDTKIAQVSDFGLARDTSQEQSLTNTGIGVGTPRYMAPEQIRGQLADERADIYSFGCLAFELLTGKPPFRGSTAMETFDMHLQNQPPVMCPINSEKTFSAELEHIVMKSLEKDPQSRYQSFDELLFDLVPEFNRENSQQATLIIERNQTDEGTSRQVAGPLKSDFKPKHVLLAFMTLCVVALLIALGGNYLFSADEDPSVKTKAFEKNSKDSFSLLIDIPKIAVEQKTGMDISSDFDLDDDELIDYLKLKEEKKEKFRGIDISVSKVTRSGIHQLAQFKELRSIVWFNHSMTVEDLKALSTLEQLDTIELGISGEEIEGKNAPNFDIRGLSELSRMPDLKFLTISGLDLTDETFEEIRLLSHLTHLYLPGCQGITAKQMDRLKELPLRSVALKDTRLEPGSPVPLASCKTLTEIDLRGSNVDLKTVEDLVAGMNFGMLILPEHLKGNAKIEQIRKGKDVSVQFDD